MDFSRRPGVGGIGNDKEIRLADIALRFVLSHPAVSTVIPGMRSTRNVERKLRFYERGNPYVSGPRRLSE